ncbi:MAG: hypothetical protein LBR08_10450 [Bacteroidales bacterium]|jgi:hypothetical protein|nr:hypothetical protein [Bacteroidales bacterium]
MNKIVEIQDITLEHTRRGISQRWVYKNLISDRYHISYSTYQNYLCRNAKKERKAKQIPPGERQLNLFPDF